MNSFDTGSVDRARQTIRARRSFWTLVIMAGVAAAILTSPVRAENCAATGDDMAMNARVLQTELMVGALTCNNQLLYNEFVRKYRAQLVEQGNSLKRMFRQKHGGAASTHLNDYITRLANEASQRSMTQRVGFCRQSSLLFAEALNGDEADLRSLIQVAATQGVRGFNGCGPSKDGTVAGYGAPYGKTTLNRQQLPKN